MWAVLAALQQSDTMILAGVTVQSSGAVVPAAGVDVDALEAAQSLKSTPLRN